MEKAHTPTSEQLLAELAWVRRLARALVKDDALADDLAQDTWLVAAEHRPDGDRPLRPWLARVVTKLVHTRRRGEARRGARQLVSADDRTVPTPEELVERVELQHAVAEEVLALAEPYRSTVLLHFIEGLSSVEIARRLGIPDGTVRRRLKVALDQLRDALRKRTDQPAHGWLAALVPFARSPGPKAATASLEIFAMKKLLVALLLLVLLIAGGVVWQRLGRPPSSNATAWTNPLLGHGVAKARAPEISTSIPSWLSPVGVAPRRIAGRVVFHGVPVPDAKVQLGLEVAGETTSALVAPEDRPQLLQPIAEVVSAADGTFDFGVQPPLSFVVSASAPSFSAAVATVASSDARAKSEQLLVELGDCRSRVYGTVADASGGAIAKAKISVAGLSGTESGPTGDYSLCLARRNALGTPIANVHVAADGYGAIRQNVIVEGGVHLDFKLVPEAVLVGRVTTTDGQPVAGARVVAVGNPTVMRSTSGWATSELDGRFRIAGLSPAPFSLFATAAGAPASTPIDVVARPAATSREVSIVLAGRGTVARVRGHVLSAGSPIGHATITALHDGNWVATAVSQADGSFGFAAVPYGAIHFHVNAYRLDETKPTTIDRAVVDDVVLDVTRMGTVRGHVTRHGRPVARARVIYVSSPQTPRCKILRPMSRPTTAGRS